MLRRVALVRTDVHQLLVAACAVPSSPSLVTLMKEALGFSETSVLTRATRHNIPEDTILHSHRRENLKFYIMFFQSLGQTYLNSLLIHWHYYVGVMCLLHLQSFAFLEKQVGNENHFRLAIEEQSVRMFPI
jgi:hypothetical protein